MVPEAPYPTHGGGALRSASVLEYLAARYQTDIVVFQEPWAPEPMFPAMIHGERLVLRLVRRRTHPLFRYARNAERLARGVPPLIDRFSGFAGPISAFVRGRQYEVAIVEHFWCAPYWEQIAPVSRTTVLDLHNIESALHARCAAKEWGPQAFAHHLFARAARELEDQWLRRYNRLFTASGEDEKIVRSIVPGADVSIYPNAIPWVPRPSRPETDVLAFSGNLEYHPNLRAVRFFRHEIWPTLRKRWPSLIWRLIGKNPAAVRREIGGDPRIEVSGPVNDAIAELAAAKVVVVPLLAGSGTRFKVIEAWAAARPVVSTTIGAEGLPARDRENLMIADSPERFADAVSRLLMCSDLRMRLGETGRALFESELTWESAWRKLESAIG